MNRLNPISLIIAVGVTIVLITGLLLTKKSDLPTSENIGAQQAAQDRPAIQNNSDLDIATAELDKTDLNEFDKGLNQLDADASTL